MSTALRYNGRAVRALIIAGTEPAWLTVHPRASYVRQAYLSVPPWMDRSELRWLDWCRRAWSLATGVEHVLDHDVPLNHPRVNGLTVPSNMRLLTRAANATRNNAWDEGQLALFQEAAQ